MQDSQKPDFIFEVSWETINKVGGINTVIASKAREMVKEYGANYFLIGPYFKEKTIGQFEELAPPEYFASIFEKLKNKGIHAYFGKWLTEGEPLAILFDFDELKPYTDSIKKELWDIYQIDSLGASLDFNDPVVWGFAVGKFIEELAVSMPEKKIIGHFHEWLSGSALLYLKTKNIDIATVFTTHATVLGRSLASRNFDFYSNFDSIDSDKEARISFVQHKHMVEKRVAENSDVFTTVSQITAMEAEHFLGRKPDVILPNGLDIEKFPTIEEITKKHRIQRDRMREFLIYYFFPHYSFDMSQSLTYFIVARNEFHNKGVDVYIKALAKLNEKMKKANSKKTVVSFFWIPMAVKGIDEKLIKARELFHDIANTFEEVKDEAEDAIFYSLIAQKGIQVEDLFEASFLRSINNQINTLKSRPEETPLLSTHNLVDQNNEILKAFRDNKLTNKAEDKVKVILYPIYLSGADGLLDLNYYESIQGSHLGVFPSFYEPWGYTPLESAALGVSSVATDLSGFGRYFKDESAKEEYPGAFIIDRFQRDDDAVVDELSDVMYKYSGFSNRERVQNKISAYNLASKADWSIFIENYFQAHKLAMQKRFK
jgi:glycogen(starch) synthase